MTSASRYITSASPYHPRYESRSSMYIRGLIPRNSVELAEAVPIASEACFIDKNFQTVNSFMASQLKPFDNSVYRRKCHTILQTIAS